MNTETVTYTRTITIGSGTMNITCVEGCERCKTDDYVPHFSCMYNGQRNGHSPAHCTANACY